MERNDKLSLQKGDATANVRMDSLNTEATKSYFDLLKSAQPYEIARANL